MTPQFPVPGMDPAATNPDAAPPMRAPPLLRRLACWVYEGMLLFGVVFIAGYLFGTLSQTRNAMDNRNPLQAFVFLIFGIYFTWFWSKGQTLAMKTWGIRLLDAHGKPPTQARAMLRYVLCWVWFLPPLALVGPLQLTGTDALLLLMAWVLAWAALSRLQRQRQFWHDTWAGTRLVCVRGESQ